MKIVSENIELPFKKRIANPARNERSKFDAGPANAIFIISGLGWRKLLALTGTGFAQPNPTNNIMIVPMGSK